MQVMSSLYHRHQSIKRYVSLLSPTAADFNGILSHDSYEMFRRSRKATLLIRYGLANHIERIGSDVSWWWRAIYSCHYAIERPCHAKEACGEIYSRYWCHFISAAHNTLIKPSVADMTSSMPQREWRVRIVQGITGPASALRLLHRQPAM